MRQLGSKQMTLQLSTPLSALPAELETFGVQLNAAGSELEYTFDATEEHVNIPALLRKIADLGIGFKDINTHKSSLEDIFVRLVSERRGEPS